MLHCWCSRRCVIRKANTLKNPERPFYCCPLSKVIAIFLCGRVDEAGEIGYFNNNGTETAIEEVKDNESEE
ncbi:hypothetical protein A2U01_0024822, partial [Trifolium medium]|nr:hypothetical protein [Trifolium medium]